MALVASGEVMAPSLVGARPRRPRLLKPGRGAVDIFTMASAPEPTAADDTEPAEGARVIPLPVRARQSTWCPECSPDDEPSGDREALAFLSHLATRHPGSPAGRAARECLAGLRRGAVS